MRQFYISFCSTHDFQHPTLVSCSTYLSNMSSLLNSSSTNSRHVWKAPLLSTGPSITSPVRRKPVPTLRRPPPTAAQDTLFPVETAHISSTIPATTQLYLSEHPFDGSATSRSASISPPSSPMLSHVRYRDTDNGETTAVQESSPSPVFFSPPAAIRALTDYTTQVHGSESSNSSAKRSDSVIQRSLPLLGRQRRPFLSSLHWRVPTVMFGSLLLGIGFALGHHFYFAAWNNKLVQSSDEQQWVARVGTGFAFLVKMFLAIATGTAYVQQLWLDLKSRPVTVESADSMFSVLANANELWDLRIWVYRPLLLLLAVITW
jgi:hypothetical protein